MKRLFGVRVPGYERWWFGTICASGIWCYRWAGMANGDFRVGTFTRIGTWLHARRAYRFEQEEGER